MSTTVLLAYVATCVLLALTPGPNMALIVANTLGAGLRAGLLTLAGCWSGLVVLVLGAAIGMTSVMVFMSEWFDVVRWVGALYLIFLGGRQLVQYSRVRSRGSVDAGEPQVSSDRAYFGQGFFVSLSNPKVLLFLGAFFPQFVDPRGSIELQLALLALLFLVTLAVVDLGYTFAVARAREVLDPRRLKALDLVSGLLLLAGGLVLAMARRP